MSISLDPTSTQLTLPITDVCEIERQVPLKYGDDAVEVPGARQLLQSLDRLSVR